MNGCQSTPESAQVQNKNPRDRGELGSLTNNQNQYAQDQYPAATPLLTKSAAMIEAGQSQVALDMLEQTQIDKLLPRPLSDQFVGLIKERNGNAEARAIAAMNLLAQLTLQDMQFMQQFCDRQKILRLQRPESNKNSRTNWLHKSGNPKCNMVSINVG